MIKHIVMWRLKSEDMDQKAADARKMKGILESMRGKIGEIRKMEVGLNFNPNDAAYDVLLYTEFDSKEDLLVYANHPEHEKVKQQIGPLRIARTVVDYEI